MRSWELVAESCVVLLGFLTLVVSLGNLSARGLQVCCAPHDNNLLCSGTTGYPALFEISHLNVTLLNLFRLSSSKAKTEMKF